MQRVDAQFRYKPWSMQQKKLLTWWKPGSPFSDYDMVIADGSVRSGKTIATIEGFLLWSLKTFEHENFILAGRSIGALKRNVLQPMFAILRAKGIDFKYVRSDDHYIQIGSNTYYCFGASSEASQDTLQGLTAAGALGDEVALMPWSFVDQAIARCSVDGSKLWFNCNPEGPLHKVKVELIDKAEEKRIFYLHFDLDDNLTLSGKIKARYKRIFSGLWYKRYILGLWVLAEGVIYDMFSDAHVFKGKLPLMERHWVAIDYGTSNDFAALLLGECGGKLYICREWRYGARREQKRQLSDAQYSKKLKAWLNDIVPERIFVDPSAASFIVQLYDDGFKGVTKADNEVLNGIRSVSSLLTAGLLLVHESCTGTIDEIHGYVWDAKAQERGEDEPLKINDHCMDAGRYGVMGTRRVWRHWISEELGQAA